MSFKYSENVSVVTPETAADSAVLSATKAYLVDVQVINTSASERYLMLFNATSLPSNGEDPVWRGVVAAGTQISLTFGGADESHGEGLLFDTGIVAALSSTVDDLTVTVATEGYFQAILRS